jgi:hypothetical protein
MGILRTAAFLGTGYFLYKKYSASQSSQAPQWDDSSPVETATAADQQEGESTFGDRITGDERPASGTEPH